MGYQTQPFETLAEKTPPAPSLRATVLLVIAAISMLSLVTLVGDPAAHVVIFAVALGLACVGIGGYVISVAKTKGQRQSDAILSAMEATGTPACLTDGDGRVLDETRAFQTTAPPDVSSTDMGVRLAHISTDPGALVFRLLNRLSSQSVAREQAEASDGSSTLVVLRRLGPDSILWTFDPLSSDMFGSVVTGGNADGVAIFTVNRFGDILGTTAFAARIAGSATTLSDVLGAEDVQSGTVLDDPVSDGCQYRVSVIPRENDLTDVVLLPIDSEEMAGASLNDLFDAMPVAMALVTPEGAIASANADLRKLLVSDELEGQRFDGLMEGLGRPIKERLNDMLESRNHIRSEMARATVDGREVYLQVTLKRLKVDGAASILAVITDATELKTLEAQFVQSQKMQAVGQLAGGVAHDFNNLLTAINGHCDLLLIRHQQGDSDYGDLVQIRQNANRAASLVGQLLAFSRKQTLLPRVLDLYNTFAELSMLLNRLLGEKVTLKIDNCSDLKPVRVDERQMEQVVMNLVVNARDAMPNGGEVTIRTRNTHLEKDETRDRAVIPFGDYVQIDVMDTGTGIPPDKITKVFEPFYTTKKTGEGTGLGLSTVYGIVKQTGGFIFADSTVGVGTTFTIFLPAFTGEMPAAKDVGEVTGPREPRDLTGRGVVLLVEDELPVRSFASRALNLRGYTVVEAASGEEALDILEDETLHVDIFVSDVIMPGIDGPTWVQEAQKTRPDAKVVFVSGYAEDAFGDGELTIPNASFLPKPFSLNELTEMVKSQICG